MASRGDTPDAPQADAPPPPAIPAMPSVSRGELYRGRPALLQEYGLRHSLGWQDDRKAGPSFVLAGLRRLDAVSVEQRYPLTEQGWASAWRALSDLDPGAATSIAAALAAREARTQAEATIAALAAESLYTVRHVVFSGGSAGALLTKGHAYDLCFLRDRIMVCPAGTAVPAVEIPHGDVETVEISGSGQDSRSLGELLALILGLGLLGALLGLLLFGLTGMVFAALLSGVVGAMVGAMLNKIETTVRVSTHDADYYFIHAGKHADALRMELSEALRAIDKSRAAPAARAGGEQDEPAGPAPESIPDELGKLASLLQQGLITRDEFDHLKAKLIARS